MSTTSNTAGLGSRIRTKAGTALAAAGLVAGVGVVSLAVATPAQAAACNSSVHSDDFWSSWAEAHTELCSYWSYSYAQHGGSSANSGWWSGWSRASADSGVSFSHSAWNVIS
jgi:hypothetical protein